MDNSGIKQLITPADEAQICKGTDKLYSSLAKLKDSYDSVFVFDNDQFLGVISIYQVLYKKPHPLYTSSARAAVRPIKITEDSSLEEIASYMAGEQIFTLPVFKGKKLIGTIKAESILSEIVSDKKLLTKVSKLLKLYPARTVNSDEEVKNVHVLLKQPRLPVVIVSDKSGKFLGSLDRNSLISAFTYPADKLRFGKNGNRPTDRSFDEEHVSSLSGSINTFINPGLILAKESSSEDLIMKLLSSGQKHVFNKSNDNLISFLSFENLLAVYAGLKQGNQINITIKKPTENVSESEFLKTYNDIEAFAHKIDKRLSLERVEVTVEEPKYPNHKTAVFNTTVVIIPYGKGHYVAQSKGIAYSQSVKSSLAQISKQLRRDRVNYLHPAKRDKSISQMTMDLQNSS